MKFPSLLAASVLCVSLWACERQGPLERAGEEVDEAIEDVRNGGETVGNQIDDTIDDVRDELDDARRDLEN